MFYVAFRSGPYLCSSKGHQHGVSIQSFIKLGKTFFPNMSYMKYRRDLILGEALCIFILFRFLDSGLSVLNDLHLFFDDVTVKTDN